MEETRIGDEEWRGKRRQEREEEKWESEKHLNAERSCRMAFHRDLSAQL